MAGSTPITGVYRHPSATRYAWQHTSANSPPQVTYDGPDG